MGVEGLLTDDPIPEISNSAPLDNDRTLGALDCVGALPGISVRTRHEGVVETRAPTLPLTARGEQYRGGVKRRKCRCFFGLARCYVHGMWMLTCSPITRSGVLPHDVDL